jgi:hypothetical protein
VFNKQRNTALLGVFKFMNSALVDFNEIKLMIVFNKQS